MPGRLMTDRPWAAQVIIARPNGHSLDCGKALRDALAAVGGRGGGQPQMAQGGVPSADQLEPVLAALQAKLG